MPLISIASMVISGAPGVAAVPGIGRSATRLTDLYASSSSPQLREFGERLAHHEGAGGVARAHQAEADQIRIEMNDALGLADFAAEMSGAEHVASGATPVGGASSVAKRLSQRGCRGQRCGEQQTGQGRRTNLRPG